MQPWAAAVMLQFPKPTGDGVILDDRFRNLATELGKPVTGLETMESRAMRVFGELPTAQQVAFLGDALTYGDEGKAIEQDLEKAYAAHDLGTIEALVPQSMALTSDPEFTRLLLDRLLYARNKAMGQAALGHCLKTAAPSSPSARCTCPAPTGMLKAFEDAGYFVEGEE